VENFNLVTAVLGLLFFFALVIMIRRDQLHVRYSIWWLLVAVTVACFGVFPALNDILAGYFDINYPPILPVIVALLLLMGRLFLADIENSKARVEMTRLVQRVALLERRIKDSDARKPANS